MFERDLSLALEMTLHFFGVGEEAAIRTRMPWIFQNAVCESPLLPRTIKKAVSSLITPKRDEGSLDA